MHASLRSPSCLAASRQRRWVAECLGLVLAALLAPGPGQAQPYGDQAAGRRLATAWCSDCHQIGPQTMTFESDAIPSFQAIAAMPSTTLMSIRVFLRTPHDVMPDYELTEAQIDDVGAYIIGLRAARPSDTTDRCRQHEGKTGRKTADARLPGCTAAPFRPARAASPT